jgi:hypothetical protein
MKYLRLPLAAVLLLVGISWLYLLNGQYYSNSLGCIALSLASAAVCAWELCSWGRLDAARLWAAVLLLLVDLGLAALLAVGLPEAQRRQQEFNRKRDATGDRGAPPMAVALVCPQSEGLCP